VAFGKRIEDKDARRAALGLRIDVQLGDESRLQSRRTPRFGVERESLRSLR
jgi:hypothetical protein